MVRDSSALPAEQKSGRAFLHRRRWQAFRNRGRKARTLPGTANAPRIVIHTPEPRSGAALYVSELVKAIAKTGTSVALFCPHNFEYLDEVRNTGAEVLLTTRRRVSAASLWSRISRNVSFLVRTAISQYRLTRPGDVVHFQFPVHLPLGFVFVFVARMHNNAVVLTAHDPLPHQWRFPRLLRCLERKMLSGFYGLFRQIIVHNDAGRNVLIRECNVPAYRISVIPHGPLHESAPTALFPAFDRLRLLMFGSIRENKGIHLAIRAVQTANCTSPLPVHLTIAGAPHNAAVSRYWSECKKLIAGTPAYFDVIEGFIPDRQVHSLLARHHAVLMPYVNFSSESGVAALAMSSQRPILATRSGGPGEILTQCNCGIRIESATIESVAQAIMGCVELGPARLAEMGSAGRRFVTQTRNWESIAQQTVQAYSHMTGLQHDEAS
jgi:glycogen synthase